MRGGGWEEGIWAILGPTWKESHAIAEPCTVHRQHEDTAWLWR